MEGAKTFARMAGDAVKGAVAAPPSASPVAVAQGAVTAAAKNMRRGCCAGRRGRAGGRGTRGAGCAGGATSSL